MRFAALALMLSLSSIAYAQTSVNLVGDVPQNRIHYYLFSVDHGVSATAVDITFDLDATGSAGLDATITDLNEWAALGPLFETSNFVWPNGNVTDTLSLPARTGVHQVLLALEIDDMSGSTPYTGTISVSTGTIAQIDFLNLQMNQAGLVNVLDRVVELQTSATNGSRVELNFELDFGPVAQTTNLRVRTGASGATTVYRLLGMATTPPTVLRSVSASAGVLIDEHAFVLGPFAGVQNFRVEVALDPAGGLVVSEIVIGTGATLTSATTATVPPPAPVKKKKKSGGCVAFGHDGGMPGAGILAVAALLVALRHKRRSGDRA